MPLRDPLLEENSQGQQHPFHLVDPSPWPFVAAVSVFVAAVGAVLFMHGLDHWVFAIGGGLIALTFLGWWRDVLREGNTSGVHTRRVQMGLRMGMALFIVSEVMFFVSFFWGYFNASLFPTEATGFLWPPKGVAPLDPFHLPYLNTLILLLSGTTVTWAHHALIHNEMENVSKALLITIVLGLTFSCVQAYEYAHATFAFKSGIYASNFYIATGFHGFHVIVGTIFLGVCYVRARRGSLSPTHHVGFEAAAWYWHFVDVVWLFLFLAIYCGSYVVP